MELTGKPAASPLLALGAAISGLGALAALDALAPSTDLPGLEVLAERARWMPLTRGGNISAGGRTRLLSTEDGVIAVTLARPSDLEMIPALIGTIPRGEPWCAVSSWLAGTPTAHAAERLSLLGIPFGVPGEVNAVLPWRLAHVRSGTPVRRVPKVVNLASMWAGPLCGAILRQLGCEVVKVESTSRPDGTRQGPTGFFTHLNGGATHVRLDFDSARGRDQLRQLLLDADVVIEGSRPRALAQLGVSAEWTLSQRNLVWISITGHGRSSDRVAFGDDAAVAGGLLADDCFVADAVADPLTGVHAALAAWSGLRRGGATLVETPLARVAAAAAAAEQLASRSCAATYQ